MWTTKLKIVTGTLLALSCVASAAVVAHQAQADRSDEAAQPARAAADARPEAAKPVDAFGDPLPEGAVARLGTVRWRHGAPVHFLALPPDGKTVISAANDRLVRVWDLSTGRELRRIGPGGDTESGNMAFRAPSLYLGRREALAIAAVSRDGELLATHFDGPAIELWEVATGNKVGSIPLDKFEVMSLAFAPSEKHLAMSSRKGNVRLWDLDADKLVREFGETSKQGGYVPDWGNSDVVYAPDGKTLVSLLMEADFTKGDPAVVHIKFWDPETGRARHTVPVKDAGLAPPVFSPDGKLLAYVGWQGNIGLIKADTGVMLHQWRLRDGGAGSVSAAFSADSSRLYSNEGGWKIREWDVKTAKELRQLGDAFEHEHQTDSRISLALSADGKTLVIGGGGSSLRFLDVASGKEVRPSGSHTGKVRLVSYSPDGKSLLTGDNEALRWWDLATGKQIKQLARPWPLPPFSAYPADGRYLAVIDLKKWSEIHLTEVGTDKQLATISSAPSGIPYLRFAPDGRTLVVCHQGALFSEAVLYEVPSGKKMYSVPLGGETTVAPYKVWFFFSPDGKYFGMHDLAKAVTIRDVVTGKAVFTIPPKDGDSVYQGAFSPDGRMVALDHGDGRARLVELATGKERGTVGKTDIPAHQFPIRDVGRSAADDANDAGVMGDASSVAFSPDSRLLALARFNSVEVWATATGQRVARFQGHQGPVTMIAFAPDGRSLASASCDTTALVWDVHGLSAKAGPAPRGLDHDALQARWNELAGDDAPAAANAINAMVAAQQQAVPFLETQLRPTAVLEPATIANIPKWIEQLDSDDLKVRQKSQTELRAAGEPVLPYLEKALAREGLTLEAQQRLKALQSKLAVTLPLSGERLRLVRAVEVLERTGTAEARQILKTLAGGAPGTLAESQSSAALKRLNERNEP